MSLNTANSHILVIDPNPRTQAVTLGILRSAGFQVTGISTAQDALAYMRSEREQPQLILLEGKLGDNNDLDICCQLKKASKTKTMMILRTFATADGDPEDIASLGANADSYIMLPIAPNVLVANINLLLRLEKAERELRETDVRTSEFLGACAHELRNPLASILNSVELLQKIDPVVTLPQEKVRMTIKRQAQQLGRMVDELIDASLVSQNNLTLQSRPMDLAAVVRSAVETSAYVMEEKQHLLTLGNIPQKIEIQGDERRLSYVMTSLLFNVAKHIKAGGQIHLSAETAHQQVVVRLAYYNDFSEGEAPGLLLNSQPMNGQKTIDLGLPLIRTLVELHGGSLKELDNHHRRLIEVSLPIYKSDASVPATGNTTPEGRNLKNILVVDDRVDVANTLAQWIGFAGHTVQTAYTGAEAIESTIKYRPEIILLDIGLPDLSGFEVAKKLCELKDKQDFLLVAVTGFGDESSKQYYLNVGFDEHFVKPMNFKKLKSIGVDI